MIKLYLLLPVVFFVCANQALAESPMGSGRRHPFSGAFIHVSHCFDIEKATPEREEAIRLTLEKFKQSGLQWVMPYATTTSGGAMYPSQIMPVVHYADWDPLEVIARESRSLGLKFCPTVCVMSCGKDTPNSILKEHPEWAVRDLEGKPLGYLSPGPPEVSDWLLSVYMEILDRYQPDGLMLDYLRYPNSRNLQLDERTQAAFEQELSKLGNLDTQKRKELFQEFKEKCLTELTTKLCLGLRNAKQGLHLSMYTWGAHVTSGHPVAQDWQTWAQQNLFDMISVSGYCFPKNYGEQYLEVYAKRLHDGLKVIEETRSKTELSVCLGVKTSHGQVESAEDIAEFLEVAKGLGVRGLAVFTWPYLLPYIDEVMENGYLKAFLSDDTMQGLKEKYRTLLTLERPFKEDEAFEKGVAEFDALIQSELDTQILDRSNSLYGTWGDVTDNSSMALSHHGRCAEHLLNLALAYCRPASRFHRNAEVMERIQLWLDGYSKWIYPGCPKPHNWWAWDIGIPYKLVDTLFLLENELPEERKAFLRDTLAHLVKKGVNPGLGANTIWIAWIQFRFGLLTQDRQYVEWGWQALNRQSEIAPGLRDGIKADYSYFMHAPGMNMGYGRPQLMDLSTFIWLTHGTEYQMQDESVHVEWFLRFIRWLVYKDTVDPYVFGRDGTRGRHHTYPTDFLRSALPLTLLGFHQADELIKESRRMLEAMPDFTSLKFMPELQYVKRSLSEPSPREGFRFYPYSSYGVCQREDFRASIRLDSTRNKKWFSIHRENLLGDRIVDGHLPLWVDGKEHSNSVLACQDWERLEGITAAEGYVLGREKLGQTVLTGGVSLQGQYGLAAMDLLVRPEPEGASLRARKSYLFLDDFILCLVQGATVQGDSAVLPYSILGQMPWTGNGKPAVLIDGNSRSLDFDRQWQNEFNWVHFGRRGIVCLTPKPVEFSWSNRSGQWSRINKIVAPDNDFEKAYSQSFLTLQRTHDDSQESFAFAVLPAANSEKTADWAKSPPVEILSCDESSHVVRTVTRNGDTLWAAVFFEGGRAAEMSSDAPLVMLVMEKENQVAMAMACLNAENDRETKVQIPLTLKAFKLGDLKIGRAPETAGTTITLPPTGLQPMEIQIPKQ